MVTSNLLTNSTAGWKNTPKMLQLFPNFHIQVSTRAKQAELNEFAVFYIKSNFYFQDSYYIVRKCCVRQHHFIVNINFTL